MAVTSFERWVGGVSFALTVAIIVGQCVPQSKSEEADYVGATDETLLSWLHIRDTIRITRGMGGYIRSTTRVIEYLKNNPSKRVIIDGQCYSSCVMLLTKELPNTCYTDRAKFYVHSAYAKDGKPNVDSVYFNQVQVSTYSPALREWAQRAQAVRSTDVTQVPANLLDVSKRCRVDP